MQISDCKDSASFAIVQIAYKKKHALENVLFVGIMICLEKIACTDTDTASISIPCKTYIVFAETYTQHRTEVNSQLQREPETVFYIYAAYSTNIAIVAYPRTAYSTTDTERPVPRTFFVPRNGSVERVDPVIGNNGLTAIETGNTGFDS